MDPKTDPTSMIFHGKFLGDETRRDAPRHAEMVWSAAEVATKGSKEQPIKKKSAVVAVNSIFTRFTVFAVFTVYKYFAFFV